MMSIENANQLRGRAMGSMILAGFGGIWLGLAFYAKEMLNAAMILYIVAGLLTLLAGSAKLMRASGRWSREPRNPSHNRAFGWINALQWIAIFIVVQILTRLHLDAYTVSAIAGIVGLHFFPLAKLFRNRMHYVTGSAMVLWAAGTALWAPLEKMQGDAAMGAGVILWGSVSITLAMSLFVVRRPSRISEHVRPETA
ncbi:MAG TPA: hypothetical protein VK574_05645 [Terracidiphilus sp.]|jgi:hypothetical protein|nr:hypothetical protein [Terracidiphilus sp.]